MKANLLRGLASLIEVRSAFQHFVFHSRIGPTVFSIGQDGEGDNKIALMGDDSDHSWSGHDFVLPSDVSPKLASLDKFCEEGEILTTGTPIVESRPLSASEMASIKQKFEMEFRDFKSRHDKDYGSPSTDMNLN